MLRERSIVDDTMYDAPSSTGRVIDHLSLKKSYHTSTADVTNACFHVDEDEECRVDAPTEWQEQQPALGSPTSALSRLRKQVYGRRRAGTRWVDFVAERFAGKSFDRSDAAPQFFATYELDVFIDVHMDDLRSALDLVQTNFSQKIRFKFWNNVQSGHEIRTPQA